MKRWIPALLILCPLLLYPSPPRQRNGPQAAPQASTGIALSLRVLQERLGSCQAARSCPDEVLKLAGMTRLVGYIVDAANRDIVLVGKIDPSLPPLHLEDLVVALRHAWKRYREGSGYAQHYENPGCSIDPDPQVVARLKEAAGCIAAGRSREAVEADIEDYQSICDAPQSVRVLGIPASCRFARVMVEADYHMKTLVNGAESLGIGGFASLTDARLEKARANMLAGRSAGVPAVSTNRFWFYPGEDDYLEDEGVVTIDECPVILLTEEEYLGQGGGFTGTGRASPMAGDFARGFSAHYDEIAEERPIYRELENLFRFVAFSKVLSWKNAPAEAGLDLGYLLDRWPVPQDRVDAALPGRFNVKRLVVREEEERGIRVRRRWFLTCGGVGMNIEIESEDFKRDTSGRLSRLRTGILQTRPSPDALYWTAGR